MIELLEGKPPYHFLDPMPAMFRIVQDDCPPIPEGISPVSIHVTKLHRLSSERISDCERFPLSLLSKGLEPENFGQEAFTTSLDGIRSQTVGF